MGVKAPPIFATRNMKKTMWYALSRPLFNRMYDRIKSIAAPVVAMRLAMTDPANRRITLLKGVPFALIPR